MPPDIGDLFTLAARTAFPSVRRADGTVLDEHALAAKKSFRRFVDFAWPILEPATPLMPNWHLDAVCEHLQAVTDGDIRNLLINIPPRHMKSLAVCVFWPAWEWIAFPQMRFLFASYTLALSQRDSVKCRRLIESPWYQQHFGHGYQLCPDQNTKLRYDNTKAGCRIATSVGGSATGEGGDRVVVDDPHNVAERESQAKRVEALTWWDETMSTRLNDPRTGAKIIVMQRLHEKDLSGHVLEQGGYEHLFLPAEFELARRCVTWHGRSAREFGNEEYVTTVEPRPAGDSEMKDRGGPPMPRIPRWADPRTVEGELLWPARIGREEIADFRIRLGPEGYAGQFQQRPSPAGGALFRKEWFRYCKTSAEKKVLSAESKTELRSPQLGTQHSELSTSYVLLRPDGTQRPILANSCERFAVMDPAGTEPGEGRRPCYTVIQVWDVTREGDMLLVHQYRRQVQAHEAAEAAIAISRDFDVAYIAIEKDGMGLGVVQQVKNAGVAVRAIKARGCKESRSQTAEIRMANGQIYFPRGADFLFELEKELLAFPRSDYSDQVDALSHAAMQVAKLSRPYPPIVEEWERQGEMAMEGMEFE